ncbi:2,3-bisphosphoglycerate-independent phosphoglycerate mutase [Sanyastnella coralliicola]|uniref:2,3-bisphosphoglycerate-independent phosphoglycerate mutase n=1 Tax=Sanyastnella coralliicola TaxID=3069118 RepID=UPI0027BA98E2|nr:2,3-bisphosphoglycerate-independent phosphoglycerate mutase [Longitalea sp. SCSIO 12813]
MTDQRKACLIVLDGWGHGKKDASDAVFQANTPFMDHLEANMPSAELLTDGENVGLPEGQMGNSEVGHMNIGAGRVVYQDLVRINKAIQDRSFHANEVLVNAMESAKSNGRLHLMGLVSNGGVHSSQEHLHALCDLAQEHGINEVYIHVFTDGRDCDPQSGKAFVEALENHIAGTNAKVASVIGRYYAMDRDKRWERVAKAYNLLTRGEGASFNASAEVFTAMYGNGTTDEFIEPCAIAGVLDQGGTIQEGDTVVCFNFRTDRCREITQALTQQDFPDQGMSKLDLSYYTMTRYDNTFQKVNVIYEKDDLSLTLGEVVSKAGRTQVRGAETEKYPHVTFFFSGGREAEFEGESRIMAHSPKVATYDLQPEMSAPELADKMCAFMSEGQPDLVVLNFANPDMVGHTGVFEAIVKAVETTDQCLKQVVEHGQSLGYSFIIIADHGNADKAVNPDGSPHTAHTTNPVPVVVIDDRVTSIENGILADVAPSILALMGVEQPSAMTGRSILNGVAAQLEA